MMRKNDIRNQNGLTLIEVLASLVILGIVFVGIMTVLPQMSLFNMKTGDKLQTMNLAKQELAEIKKQERIEKLAYTNVNCIDCVEFNRYVKNKNGYDYIVDVYLSPELEGESTDTTLFKIHLKITKENRTISETYGYVNDDLTAVEE